jgi:hypothetical protein
MANSRPSFQKRQKEMARQQRAADKLQRRLQKKQGPVGEPNEQRFDSDDRTDGESSQTVGLNFHDF